MACGEFMKMDQGPGEIALDKWVFTCIGINIPIDGGDIETILGIVEP